MHCVDLFYMQGITCKYLYCNYWTYDAAMSKVYGEKKNDRSHSPLDLPHFSGILMPQWSIGYYNKLKTTATNPYCNKIFYCNRLKTIATNTYYNEKFHYTLLQ